LTGIMHHFVSLLVRTRYELEVDILWQ